MKICWRKNQLRFPKRRQHSPENAATLALKSREKKTASSVYDCTVEDVEYICNSNSTLCLFYFAIFVVLLLA